MVKYQFDHSVLTCIHILTISIAVTPRSFQAIIVVVVAVVVVVVVVVVRVVRVVVVVVVVVVCLSINANKFGGKRQIIREHGQKRDYFLILYFYFLKSIFLFDNIT